VTSGIIRVVVGVNGGIPRPAINVWHANVADAEGGDSQTVVDAIRDFYTTAASIFPTSVTMTIGQAVTLITSVPPIIIGITPRVVAGTGTGGASAAQLAEVVSWRTPFAGRSFRGRTYLGPIAVSALTGGILSTPVVTACQNAANAYVAASNSAAAWDAKVWSEKLQSSSQITSAVANSKVETQRRRNR